MISDSHTDFLTELKTKDEIENYVKSLREQQVRTISSAVFTTNQKLKLNQVVKFSNEVERLKTKYGVDLKFSVEDIGFLETGEIERFVKLKPISTTLTWHYDNQFAGGDAGKKGLTKLGKETVAILERNNILIDTAHMSRKSFWDFSKITSKPIYNSHSNIYSLHKHNRNLTDKQIKKIIDTNGYLGLTIYDKFVKGQNISSLDVAKQFDYLIKNFGYLNFGLGTDFYGIDKQHLPTDVSNYKELENTVKKHLNNMGYSNKIIECILYKNFEEFLKRTKLSGC